MHKCVQLTAAFWTLEPFGEIGANFSLQLSSRTRFDKNNKKKVITENQCEKHKKSSLATTKGALEIRRIFSLVDLITKPKFSNCPNVFKIGLFL